MSNTKKFLLVQEYLMSGKTLHDLQVEHGVYSNITNGKISLNYDMIEASSLDPLASQCRGLILRENTYDLVAYGMNRFFNLAEEGIAAEIDWNSSVILNKLDGTCIIVYFDDILNKWCCATRSRAESDVKINDYEHTFATLVDYTIKEQFNLADLNSFMNTHFAVDDKKYTFVFELTTPLNRIVCEYNDYRLTLLAVRDIQTLLEHDPVKWERKNVGLNIPEIFNYTTTEQMISAINEFDPKTHEGVVIKDKNYNRIKVKNAAYVAINKLRDSLSTSLKGCLELLVLGKGDDVIGMLPDFIVKRINKLKPALQKVFKVTLEEFEEIKHIDNMKEFAMIAELKLWPGALYALKRNKTPDLKTFAMGGNKFKNGKIPSSSMEQLLYLCQQVDPTVKELNV